MSTPEKQAPAKADNDANEAAGAAGDDNHEEAAEILTDLVQNQMSLSSNVAEAQTAALQQLLQQGGASASKQQNLQALIEAAMKGDVAVQQQLTGEKKQHAFWDTQPMLNSDSDDKQDKSKKAIGNNATSQPDPNWHKPIVPDKEKEDLRQEPYNMPKGFEWCEVDITDEEQRTEIYDLLYQNYVEDDDGTFRFDYSRDFLTWALTPPGYLKQFHLGVRSSKSNRLMALITAVPAKVRVYREEKDMAEVNFLCVHRKLRSKRLAPVLIKEITRRVNHTGVFQAVYTAGVKLPGSVASCRYYHRTLDARKLIEVGFTRLAPRMTMARLQKLNKLPAAPITKGLRAMTPDDVPAAHKLVVKYLEKFQLAVVFSEDEFAHWLLPRRGVVSSFVREDADGVITDFCSYYHLNSSVARNPKHNTLNAAYSFYNVAKTVSLTDLMKDCLILAKNEGTDVFNALNLMENSTFLEELRFGMGDGNLQYYVYNWFCPTMQHNDVGLVLL
ncbi:hypothetical protein ACHAWT_006610 [Skeletonema menzelii]